MEIIYQQAFIHPAFFLFKDKVSKKQMDGLISKINDRDFFEAAIMQDKKLIIDENRRKSRIALLPPEGAVFDIIKNLALKTNKDHWKFKGPFIYHNLQYAEYTSGDHFDWHHDMYDGDKNTRIISAVLLAADPNSFVGGEFEISDLAGRIYTPHLYCGSIIIYPACHRHRVKKILHGVRRSIGLSIISEGY